MRNLRQLDHCRDSSPEILSLYGWAGNDTCGVFTVLSVVDRAPMRVIASTGGGWDHVSISRKNRCPNWPEMEQVKRLFFNDDEVAMQLHVPAPDHISIHPHCLHLWRPQNIDIPRPPSIMVGPKVAA